MSAPTNALLLNPAAGKGSARAAAEAVLRELGAAGRSTEVLVDESAERALAQAKRLVAEGVEVLTVVGGDGMVHLGLQAVAGTDTALAVIPGGTGNDFARALGIPRNDPAAAARLITEGTTKSISLGRCGDEWFGSIVCSGFDSLVNRRTNTLKWPRGKARYNLAVLIELARLKPLPFRIRLDDKEEIVTDATLVAVGNTSYYGGGMKICPAADPATDTFEITLLKAVGRVRLAPVFPRIFNGTHVKSGSVRTFTAKKVELECPEVFAYADGDFIGDLPLTIECVPNAAKIIVPRDS